MVTSKDITSCGTELTVAGTYIVTQNLDATEAGDDCVYIDGNGITVNLDGHAINGDGSKSDDSKYCVYISGNDNTVTGGTLNDCYYGVYFADTVSTTIQRLEIYTPSEAGVYESYSSATRITSDKVIDEGSDGYAVELIGGTGTNVSETTATYTSEAPELFYVEEEYGDVFSSDVAEFVNGSGAPVTYGGEATGFIEYYCNHDRYVSDRSVGNDDGLYLKDDEYGVVTALGNFVEDYDPTDKTAYGSYDYYLYKDYDYYSAVYPYPKDLVENNVGVGGESAFIPTRPTTARCSPAT